MSRRIQITFLGTSAGSPSIKRGLPAVLVSDGLREILLDCGEGTQHRLLRVGVSVHRIDMILITHLHGDHLFGLPGLIASMTLLGRVRELKIAGPVGIREYIEANIKFLSALPFRIRLLEIEPPEKVTTLYREENFEIQCVTARHTIEACAYALIWRVPVGKFDPEKARKLNIPIKYWKKLHYGETVTLEDGRVIRPEDVVKVRHRGTIKIAYTGDTAPTETIIELAKEADILIHEATFSAEEDPHTIWKQGHSRTIDAAEIAKRANVRTLILTHISTRYEGIEEKLLQEAKTVFPNTYLANDFDKYYITTS